MEYSTVYTHTLSIIRRNYNMVTFDLVIKQYSLDPLSWLTPQEGHVYSQLNIQAIENLVSSTELQKTVIERNFVQIQSVKFQYSWKSSNVWTNYFAKHRSLGIHVSYEDWIEEIKLKEGLLPNTLEGIKEFQKYKKIVPPTAKTPGAFRPLFEKRAPLSRYPRKPHLVVPIPRVPMALICETPMSNLPRPPRHIKPLDFNLYKPQEDWVPEDPKTCRMWNGYRKPRLEFETYKFPTRLSANAPEWNSK